MCDDTKCEEEEKKICAVCKIATKIMCNRCKIVYYCGSEHQKLDWKLHSKNCSSFMLVEEDPTFGRHCVATRKIENNEIVMNEKPLFVTVYPTLTAAVCLNCYLTLDFCNVKYCKKCGWTLCKKCKKHGPECELTLKYRGEKVKITMKPQDLLNYNAVTILRALDMRENNPEAYEKLMKLEDHSATLSRVRVDFYIPTTFSEIARNVKTYTKIDMDETEIMKILSIIGVNAFDKSLSEKHDCVAVYDKPCYISHDCRPNCSYDINDDAMVIRAVETIPEGQPITVSYTDTLLGTTHRRRILKQSKFFDCTCKRCKDPTDFGTFFNAIKCINDDCTGHMLPSTFVVSKNEKIPDFFCNECSKKVSSIIVEMVVEDVSRKIAMFDETSMYQLKKCLKEISVDFHKNHFMMVKVELMLTKAFYERNMNVIKHLPKEQLRDLIDLCVRLVKLLKILAPQKIDKMKYLQESETACRNELSRRGIDSLCADLSQI